MTNWTSKGVRRSRAVRGMVALAVAGVCVIGVSACTSSVSGEAVPTGMGSSGGGVITAAPLSSVQCAQPQLAFETYCTTTAPTPRDIPSGSSLTLRAGDAVALTTNAGVTRACTIGAFVRDSAGAIWALSGAGCASSSGTATTLDGYKLGEVKVVIARTASTARVPAIKLSDSVRWSQSAKSLGSSTAVSAPVTVHAPHGDTEWAGTNVNALVWRGAGAAPKMQLGDAGSPVVQGDVLVGLADQQTNLLPVDTLRLVLDGLGAGTALAT